MSKLPHYNAFRTHALVFNTLLTTSLVVALSILVGKILKYVLKLDQWDLGGLFWILAACTIIVFFAQILNPELRIPYYKAWEDMFYGRKDQKKILRQFAKHYKLSTWKIRLNKVEPDGRWNFHVDTPYVVQLSNQRNILMNQVYQDYLEALTTANQHLLRCQSALKAATIKYETCQELKALTDSLLEDAALNEEVYVQRQKQHRLILQLRDHTIIINQAKRDLEIAKEKKQAVIDDFTEVSYRITKLFDLRYEKYTNRAIKKINRINQLKYRLPEMAQLEKWANHPTVKELVIS